MTRPTLTPAQTRALMWLDREWRHVGGDYARACNSTRLYHKKLIETSSFIPARHRTEKLHYRLTPAGLDLKAALQRERSADAGPSDTEMLDWVERQRGLIEIQRLHDGRTFGEHAQEPLGPYPTFRAALSAAMQSDPSTNAAATGDNETSRG